MSEQTTYKQQYIVSIYEPKDGGGTLVFTFLPKVSLPETAPDRSPKHVPQFIVTVNQGIGAPVLDWDQTPDDPGAAKKEIETEVLARMHDRAIWVDRVNSLVAQVEQWAKEMGWSTRRVEKKLSDVRIGEHRVPALLMQEDTCRILLEPVGRSAPGAEGVVDLYLMPAYDDIASLYYYENRWNVHYMFPGTKSVATIREAAALPLSEETLQKVLAEMRQNAA